MARCRERGYKWRDILPCVVSKQGDIWTVDEKHKAYPRDRKKNAPPPAGAGAALKRMLKRIGITSSPTCKCNSRAREMDRRGLQWCRENVTTISGWLAEEAAKRKLPYSDLAGRALIALAIRAGEKTPGAVP